MAYTFLPFTVEDPVTSITKIGSGSNLYAIVDDIKGARLMPVGSLPLTEVVLLSKSGFKFIEVQKGNK